MRTIQLTALFAIAYSLAPIIIKAGTGWYLLGSVLLGLLAGTNKLWLAEDES